jgi:PAS domain S-box-containing protein
MSEPTDREGVPEMPRRLRMVAFVAGAFVTLLGLITSAGWVLHLPALVQLHPSFAPMVLKTALCFVLAGCGLVAFGIGKPFVGRWCGVAISTLAALTLIAYSSNPGPRIQRLETDATIADPGGPALPIPMAPNTATAFLLVGLALALAGRSKSSSGAFVGGGVAGIAVIALSAVALLGYLFGIMPAFGWGQMIGMSPQSAVGLAIIGFAIVSVIGRPDLTVGHHRKRWLAFLVGCASATTTLLLWQALAADQERALQKRLDAETSSIRNAVSWSLQLHVNGLTRLAHRWEGRVAPLREEWQDDAGSYVRDFPGFQAVEWTDPEARLRWVVPFPGNEDLLAAGLLGEGRRRAAVAMARSSNRAVIAGPVDLVPDAPGFLVLVPLSPQHGLGGFVVGGFRGTRFLDSVLSPESRSSHRISLLLAEGALGLAQPGSSLSRSFESRSSWSLLGQQWSLQVVPTASWAGRQLSMLPFGALCGGLLFSGLLAWSVLQTGEARLTVLAQRHSAKLLRDAHAILEREHRAAEEQSKEVSQIHERLIQEVAERRVAEAQRDQFFSLSIDMLCISSGDGFFKRLNPAFERTLGYTIDELLGRPFLDFVHPDDAATTLAEVDKQLSRGVPTIHFENRYRCKDGTYRWLAWTSMPDVKSGMMYALARDVTASKALEAERERLILELQSTLAQVRTLSELLPMCSGCRRIRDDEDGSWSQLERYLSKTKSGTQVSHGICPDCTRKLYPAYAQRMEASERGEKP